MINFYKIVFFVGLFKISIQSGLPEGTLESFTSSAAYYAPVSNLKQSQNRKIALNPLSKLNLVTVSPPFASNLASENNLNEIQKNHEQTFIENRIIEENTQTNNNNWALERNSQGEASQPNHTVIEQNNANTQTATEKLEGSEEKNVMVPIKEHNSQLIAVLPVKEAQFEKEIVAFKPDIQYYLHQTNTSNIVEKIRSVQIPSFLKTFKPGQVNIKLTRAQIEIYKQYLIDTGLIRLKPYKLIFSKKNSSKLPSLYWMVINVELNSKFCQQPCKKLYKRSTFLSAFIPKPVRFLVPVMKVKNGLKDAVSGTQTVLGGLQDVTGGMFRMAQEGVKTTQDLTMSAARKLYSNNNESTKSGKTDEIQNADN